MNLSLAIVLVPPRQRKPPAHSIRLSGTRAAADRTVTILEVNHCHCSAQHMPTNSAQYPTVIVSLVSRLKVEARPLRSSIRWLASRMASAVLIAGDQHVGYSQV
jgi:hypothetical protein